MKGFGCDEALRCLDDLHGGVIEEQDRAALEVHLAICEDCRERHEFWQRVGSAMQDTPLAALTEEASTRLLSGVPPAESASSRAPWIRRILRYAAAIAVFRYGAIAAVAVAGATVTGIVAFDRLDRPSEPALPPTEVVEEPTGRPSAIRDVAPAPEVRTEPATEAAVPPHLPEEQVADSPAVEDPAVPPEQLPIEASTPAEGAAVEVPAELALVDRRPVGAAPPVGPPTVDQLTVSAREHRLARRYDEACRDYQILVESYPGTSAAGNGLVALGQLNLGPLHRPDHALVHFDTYLDVFRDGDLAEDARAGRVRALDALQREAEVVAAAQQYLVNHPGGSARAEVLHFQADAHRALGDDERAADAYREILATWPESTHAAWAAAVLQEMGVSEIQ